jgi:hypothetical protein
MEAEDEGLGGIRDTERESEVECIQSLTLTGSWEGCQALSPSEPRFYPILSVPHLGFLRPRPPGHVSLQTGRLCGQR